MIILNLLNECGSYFTKTIKHSMISPSVETQSQSSSFGYTTESVPILNKDSKFKPNLNKTSFHIINNFIRDFDPEFTKLNSRIIIANLKSQHNSN